MKTEENHTINAPMIIDAHQDLAWNILNFQRDYTRSAIEIRQKEQESLIPSYNGDTLLGWPEFQRGRVAIVFGVLFGLPARFLKGNWETQAYGSTQQAHTIYRRQLDCYNKLVDDAPDKFRLVTTRLDLEEVIKDWENPHREAHPVGLVPLMEGAEGIRDVGETEEWWEMGVRIIGPAWSGTRFCGGTNEPGPLTKEGYQLLESMAHLDIILDITHMDERAALQALEFYPEGIIASHSNALKRLKGVDSNRHLTDEVIRGLVERDGVIGVVLCNRFLMPGWKPGDPKDAVTFQHVLSQIDYICQMAGDAAHVGIGTDFDGGFGMQTAPSEVDTIADLQKMVPLLLEKGYSHQDIHQILGGNWLRILRQRLPEA